MTKQHKAIQGGEAMKNENGTFTVARQPTAEQLCMAVTGMQTASASNFVLNNINMFSDNASDNEFDQWLKQKAWAE